MESKQCFWIGCRKVFPSLKELCDHFQSVHAKEVDCVPQFKCPHTGCYEAFSSSENLKFHMRTHNNDSDKNKQKPSLTCPKCGKIYWYKSSLEQHIRERHGNKMPPCIQKPYYCSVGPCKKRFLALQPFYRHIQKEHGNEEYDKIKKIKPSCKKGRIGLTFVLDNNITRKKKTTTTTKRKRIQKTVIVDISDDDVIYLSDDCEPQKNKMEVVPEDDSGSGKSFLIANILHYPEFYGAVVERLGYVFNKPLLLSLLRLHLGSHILLRRGHIALLDAIVDVYNESKEQKSSTNSEPSMENIMKKASRSSISSPSFVNSCTDDDEDCDYETPRKRSSAVVRPKRTRHFISDCDDVAGYEYDLGQYENLTENSYAKVSASTITALVEVIENCEKQREAGVKPEQVDLLFDDNSAIAYSICLADANEQKEDPSSRPPGNFFYNKQHMMKAFSDLIEILDQGFTAAPQSNNLPSGSYMSDLNASASETILPNQQESPEISFSDYLPSSSETLLPDQQESPEVSFSDYFPSVSNPYLPDHQSPEVSVSDYVPPSFETLLPDQQQSPATSSLNVYSSAFSPYKQKSPNTYSPDLYSSANALLLSHQQVNNNNSSSNNNNNIQQPPDISFSEYCPSTSDPFLTHQQESLDVYSPNFHSSAFTPYNQGYESMKWL